MLIEDSLAVGSGDDHQAAVVGGDRLHGRPGGHDPVRRPEGEVVQVLVEGVARGHRPRIGWFVNQHGVHGHDIWTREALHVVDQLRYQHTRSSYYYLSKFEAMSHAAVN